jgi:uncharacterized protein YcaQ
MKEKRMREIERKIEQIKQELGKIGPLRPGSLTRQYKDPRKGGGPYWQISYTRKMKSHTAYVRREDVAEIRRQIAAYKRFNSLVEQWIDLGIELSSLKMQIDKNRGLK